MDRYVSTAEVQKRYKIAHSTCYLWIERYKLRTKKESTTENGKTRLRLLISLDDLERVNPKTGSVGRPSKNRVMSLDLPAPLGATATHQEINSKSVAIIIAPIDQAVALIQRMMS